MSPSGLSRRQVEAIVALVTERTGLTFGSGQMDRAEAGIRRAAARVGAPDANRFRERLRQDLAAFEELVAELTVGETYLFREAGQLEYIRRVAIPELLRGRAAGAPLRVWSAGCATGEEAYSLAILLHELGLGDVAEVVGTDIASSRLIRAERAVYGKWAFRGVPEAVVSTYFEPRGKRFALDAAIRERVRFRQLNLAEDVYPSVTSGIWRMDLILCRNVLIYFDRATITRVAQRLLDSLSDDGWLFLGASDPLLSELVPCEVIVTDSGLAYRKARQAASVRPRVGPTPTRTLPPPERPTRLTVPAPLRDSAPLPPAPARPPVVAPPTPSPADPVAADPVERLAAGYAARRYAEVETLAERLPESASGDVRVWVLRIRALAKRGELATAGRVCSAALERHPLSAELMYLHAMLLLEAGRTPEAADAARRALYLDPGLVVAHLALGSALVRQGEPVPASRAFRNAERLLSALAPERPVPSADGEAAGRLLDMARAQLHLLPPRTR